MFLTVSVPVYNSTLVDEDGTVIESRQNREIFLMKTNTEQALSENSFHTKENTGDTDYWVELPSLEEGVDLESRVRTYVFGYSVYLKPDEVTKTLFDYIELKNIIQYEVDPNSLLIVDVDAVGIQADCLIGINKDDGASKTVMTEEQLTRIYRYIRQPEEFDG